MAFRYASGLQTGSLEIHLLFHHPPPLLTLVPHPSVIGRPHDGRGPHLSGALMESLFLRPLSVAMVPHLPHQIRPPLTDPVESVTQTWQS